MKTLGLVIAIYDITGLDEGPPFYINGFSAFAVYVLFKQLLRSTVCLDQSKLRHLIKLPREKTKMYVATCSYSGAWKEREEQSCTGLGTTR